MLKKQRFLNGFSAVANGEPARRCRIRRGAMGTEFVERSASAAPAAVFRASSRISEDICRLRRFFEAEGANAPAENPAMLLNWLLEVAAGSSRERRRSGPKRRSIKEAELQEIGLAALDRLAGNNPDIGTVVADPDC